MEEGIVVFTGDTKTDSEHSTMAFDERCRHATHLSHMSLVPMWRTVTPGTAAISLMRLSVTQRGADRATHSAISTASAVSIMQMITVASLATSVAALMGTGREWKIGIPYEIERSPWIDYQYQSDAESQLAHSPRGRTWHISPRSWRPLRIERGGSESMSSRVPRVELVRNPTHTDSERTSVQSPGYPFGCRYRDADQGSDTGIVINMATVGNRKLADSPSTEGSCEDLCGLLEPHHRVFHVDHDCLEPSVRCDLPDAVVGRSERGNGHGHLTGVEGIFERVGVNGRLGNGQAVVVGV
jgi:hypothetical protein